MTEILLSSEMFIKSVTNVSDNLAPKFLLSSLREAQEVSLKSILGDALLEKLKSLVESKAIEEDANAKYRYLLGKCQYYLAYMTIVEVINKVSFKIGNAGLVKTSDENMQVASMEEIVSQIEYYQGKADFHCYEVQNYILEEIGSFPEVNENICHRIHANLHSAASCGVFLGGARGKRRRRV